MSLQYEPIINKTGIKEPHIKKTVFKKIVIEKPLTEKNLDETTLIAKGTRKKPSVAIRAV